MPPLDEPPPNPKNPPKVCQAAPSRRREYKCENCGKTFEGRRGGNRFCSDDCRYQYTSNSRSATRHARAALKVIKDEEILRVRDQSLIISTIEFSDSLPSGSTDRREVIWKELRQLDALLFWGRLTDPMARRYIMTRATLIAMALRHEGHPTDRALHIHAREILSNVGIEGPATARKIRELLGHARAVVRYYLTEKKDDFLGLARALMTWGNIQRTLWGEAEASPRFTWAYDVLNERCYRYSPNDRRVAWYFHRATSWRLRCRGPYLGVGERRTEVDRLQTLAETVDDSMLWVEHYRDIAGYSSYLLRDRCAAAENLRDLKDARDELEVGSSSFHLDPTILRATIEFLFDGNSRSTTEEAIELIRGQYFSLYLDNRTLYYHQQLLKWSRERHFHFAEHLPLPEYFNAFFVPHSIDCQETECLPWLQRPNSCGTQVGSSPK